MLEYVKCNLCGLDNTKLLFTKYSFNIVRCRRCNFIYVNPRPTEDEMANFYTEEYFYDSKGAYGYENYSIEGKIHIQRRIKIVETYTSSGKLLEVGCATGQWLKAMKEKNWDVYGIELSEFASKYARDKFGLNVLTGRLKEQNLLNNYFDVVVMWDTIEHLINPMAELIEVNRILKKMVY